MKQVLITGLNGRLAPYLKAQLEGDGISVRAFDRSVLDIGDRAAQLAFLQQNSIDTIFHLATGSDHWAGLLAGVAAELDIGFVLTSTESVFNSGSTGPFTPDHPADATGGYGAYKIRAETAVRAQNTKAIIARLGWQMFNTFERDNLLTHVRDMVNDDGVLFASTEWRPAVAFVGHTMAALVTLAQQQQPGTYHIGGNESALSFYDLVSRINHTYSCGWTVKPSTDPSRDGRIIDIRVPCGRIETVLDVSLAQPITKNNNN
jgi:dTDP-4-dehydrorhamnose reductase